MENKTCQITVHVNASREDVWGIITSPAEMASLIGTEIKTKFKYFGDIVNGKLGALDRVFEVRIKPHDIEIFDEKIRVGFRVTQNPDFTCEILAVAISSDPSDAENAPEILTEILRRVKITSEPANEISAEYTGQEQQPSSYQPFKYKAEKKPTPTLETNEQNQQQTYIAPQTTFQKHVAPFLIYAATVVVAVLGLFTYNEVTAAKAPKVDTEILSEFVTFENVGTIKIGDTRQTVETLLKTSGEEKDGETFYKSLEVLPVGESSYQTSIGYDNVGNVNRIEYIDLSISSAIEPLVLSGTGEVTANMTMFDVENAIGSKVSLFRNYIDANGNEMLEVHFGYSDPFASFSNSFRGEYAVYINRTTGEIKREQLKEYEGYDPLLIPSLEQHPASAQYASYDEFIADRYITQKAEFLANDYSKGDLAAVFDASLDIYSTVNNNLLHNVNSATGPLVANNFRDAGNYKLTAILDENGAFKLGSFTNLKLMTKEGMLNETRFRQVSRDMSKGEIDAIMPVLPTSIIFDINSITYCYGRYLERTEVDQQFEVIVVYDKTTMLAENVYINAQLAEGGTSGLITTPEEATPTPDHQGEMPPSAGEQQQAIEQEQEELEAGQTTQTDEAQTDTANQQAQPESDDTQTGEQTPT